MNKNQLMCVVLCLLILISFAQVHSFGDDENDAKSSGSEKSSEESTGSEPNSVIVKSSKGVDKGRESREESQQLVFSNSPKAVERKLEISKRQNVLETASPNDTEKNLVSELGSTTIEDMNVTKSRSNFTPKSGRSSQKSTNKPGLLEGAASTGSQEDMTASSGTGEGSTPEPSEEAVQSRDRSLRNSGNRVEDPNRSPLEQKKADGAVPDSFHTSKTIEPPASDSNEGVLALSSIQRLMSGATNLIGRLPLVNRFVSKESPAVKEDADNTRALRNKELQEQKDLAEKLQSLEAVHSQLRQEKEDISVQFQNVSRKNLHLEEAKQIHESSSSRVLLTVTHEFYENLKILNPLELGNKISELFSEVNIPPGLRENIGPKTFAVSHFRDNDVIVLEAVHEKAAAVIVAALQAPNIMPIFQDLLNAVYSSGTLLSELQDRKLFGVSGFRALPGSYPRKLKKGVSRDFFALATLFPLLCGTAVGFACAWVGRRHYIRAEILKHERNNCY